MKPTKFVTGLFAAAMVSPAFAQTPTFEISGATAFRRATIESITSLFVNSGQPFRFGSNRAGTDYVNADLVIWEGKITGLNNSQTVIIRCSFNGSIEGLRAIAESPAANPSYFLPNVLTVAPAVGGAQEAGAIPTGGNTEPAETEIVFSDTDKAISPYAPFPMDGDTVGVAVFGLVVNEGSPITNVSVQNYNSLLQNGRVPLSFFTGNPADTSWVFCTGRNDGSGTRSSYLAEMGYGVSNPVQQFLVVSRDGDEIRAIQRVPAGGTNDVDPNTTGVQLPPGSAIRNFHDTVNPIVQEFTSRSIVWGNDIPGNGGAFSGSVLRGDLARKGTSVRVFDANGSNLFPTAQSNISLVSWISLNDAVTARDGGASIVAFNGYKLDVNADANGNVVPGGIFMSNADKQKCYNGQYSAWNFQQMYRRFGADSNTVQLFILLRSNIPQNLGTAGLNVQNFKVGRAEDGGTMNPLDD